MRTKYLPYAHHTINDEDIEAVTRALKSNWITTGPTIDRFERAICDYVKTMFGVAVNSGTSALDIAIASLGLKVGEVITTPFTFVATANVILFNGLRPVFADIRRDTYNIDPEKIREKITDKTRAIICVDYAGQPCDLKEIKEIAAEHNLYLVEDAAQALGSEYEGKKLGSFADVTEFSFHPAKHITTGEGGMCVTDNEELADKMRMLRNHGIDKDARERYGQSASWSYDQKLLSRNYRMTDFQAALGISQLKRIEKFIKRRKEIAKIYTEAFDNISEVMTPYVQPYVRHTWHLYTILLNGIDRGKFFKWMREANIGVNVHYIPVYRHSYYEHFKLEREDFPVTEDIFNRIITLPLFPKMNDKDVYDVVDAVRKGIKGLKKR
jgi:UDP-4-amino-4,6-dideoxy-N-acetyl-beta-L-altrosamine transaminase